MLSRALLLMMLVAAPAAAQDVLVVPQTTADAERKEFWIATEEPMDARSIVSGYGYAISMAQAFGLIYERQFGTHILPAGSRVIYLLGLSTYGQMVPHRISIFSPGKDGHEHQLTVALTENGEFVQAQMPKSFEYALPEQDGRESRFMAPDYWFLTEKGHSEE